MASERQISLFPGLGDARNVAKPTNVASVPQYSPFRYPGGKTWFVPVFRRWIVSLPERPARLIEPFAGGGVISLTAIMEGLVDQVVMVELDEDVAAVWHTILAGNAEWLAKRILAFDISVETVQAELAKKPGTIKEKGFQTILRNRVLHGGILARGASFIKKGENGKGIASRWYAKTLARRIMRIAEISDKIQFIHGDGLEIMVAASEAPDAAFFVDPPYTAGGKRAGRRLYTHHELDHPRLFSLCSQIQGPFLMTYDDTEEVKNLAARFGFQAGHVAMKNTHHATRHELVISSDLSWL